MSVQITLKEQIVFDEVNPQPIVETHSRGFLQFFLAPNAEWAYVQAYTQIPMLLHLPTKKLISLSTEKARGSVAWSSDSQRIALLSEGGYKRPSTVTVWRVNDQPEVEMTFPIGYGVLHTGIVWSPDGSRLALTGEQSSAGPAIFTYPDGKLEKSVGIGAMSYPRPIGWRADDVLITVDGLNRIDLIEVASNGKRGELALTHMAKTWSISSDGHFAAVYMDNFNGLAQASGDADPFVATFSVFDVDAGELLTRGTKALEKLIISPDGKFVLGCASDITLIEVGTGNDTAILTLGEKIYPQGGVFLPTSQGYTLWLATSSVGVVAPIFVYDIHVSS